MVSKLNVSVFRHPLLAQLLLFWYLTFAFFMAISPVDRKIWLAANVLPFMLVAALVMTYRQFPLSNGSYFAIAVWLTLHTLAVHYTYPKVPFGFWIDQWFHFHRNHFDRIVHFCFGFALTYPIEETFRRLGKLRGWLITYLVIMTILGFSAFWEIIEAWVGQAAHSDLEKALVGHQGDVWDPQKDMAAAFYGTLLCIAVLFLFRKLRERPSDLESSPLASH